MKALVPICVQLMALVVSLPANGAPTFVGKWEAFAYLSRNAQMQSFAQNCQFAAEQKATIDLWLTADGGYEGVYLATDTVHVFGQNSTGVGSVKDLVARCGLKGAKDPLIASRSKRFLVRARPAPDGRSLRSVFHSGSCTMDWCDGGPFGWGEGNNPPDFKMRLGFSDGRMVMDDGAAGLSDDWYHFLTAAEYARLAAEGEELVSKFLRLGLAGQAKDAKALLSDRNTLTPEKIGEFMANISNDLNSVKSTSTLWAQAMTFPDQSDPNEYMTVITQLRGPSDRVSRLICFVQGPRNDLRIDSFRSLGF